MEKTETTGKVQVTEYGVNVLVETIGSSNRHESHLNSMVENVSPVSDSDILEKWRNRKDKSDELSIAKIWIKKTGRFCGFSL